MEETKATAAGRQSTGGADDMKQRRITLEDGRYLIFYTFDDAPTAPVIEEKRREPDAQPVATEERHV